MRKEVNLQLHNVTKNFQGQVRRQTPNTGLRLEVTAFPTWVKIVPTEQVETYLPPKTFIHAYIPRDNTNALALSIYTKQSDGSYFDEDFRAEELTLQAAAFILEKNPRVDSLLFEWRQGSDTLKEYDAAKDMFVKQGLSDEQTQKFSAQMVWTYRKVAIPLGFTAGVENFEDAIDAYGNRVVRGSFRRATIGQQAVAI